MIRTYLGDFKDVPFSYGADLVITDPPYGNIVSDSYDNIHSINLVLLLYNVVDTAFKFLKDNGSLIIFGGVGSFQNRPFFKFISELENVKPQYFIRDFVTWKKTRGYGVQDRYLFTREEFIWIVKKDSKYYFNKPYLDEKHSETTLGLLKKAKYKPHSNFKRRSNVWTDIREVMRNKIVSAEKPAELYSVIINAHCPKGGLILDFFGGSGNSVVAAVNSGMNIEISEVDPTVYDLMKGNIRKRLGIKRKRR